MTIKREQDAIKMARIALALALGSVVLGCSNEPWPKDISVPRGFRIAMINDTKERLHDVTCEYDEDRPPVGEMDPGISATADAYRPTKGPIRVTWKTSDERYEVDIPLKDSYVLFPEGTLVIRIRTDHTV